MRVDPVPAVAPAAVRNSEFFYTSIVTACGLRALGLLRLRLLRSGDRAVEQLGGPLEAHVVRVRVELVRRAPGRVAHRAPERVLVDVLPAERGPVGVPQPTPAAER